MKIQKNRAFTLIELLIVIAIIGILAAVILVSLNSARDKGKNTHVLAEVSQIKTQLEQDYAAGFYADINGTATHETTITAGSSGEVNLTTLACDIGNQNGYPNTVSGDFVVTCNGVAGLHSGVIIYSNRTGATLADYGIYATTSPGGYICFDSFGNSVSTTTASIPPYVGITSTSTALCQ